MRPIHVDYNPGMYEGVTLVDSHVILVFLSLVALH